MAKHSCAPIACGKQGVHGLATVLLILLQGEPQNYEPPTHDNPRPACLSESLGIGPSGVVSGVCSCEARGLRNARSQFFPSKSKMHKWLCSLLMESEQYSPRKVHHVDVHFFQN